MQAGGAFTSNLPNPRRPVWRRLAGLLLVSALILTSTGYPTLTAQSDDAELEKIRHDIEKLRRTLESVRGRAQTAEQELEAIELELAIRNREVDLAREVHASLEQERTKLEATVAGLTSRITRQKKQLSARAVALYKLGGLSYLRILLSLDGKSNPFEAAAMLSYVIGRDAAIISRYQTTTRVLGERRAELAAQQAFIARARERVETMQRQAAEAKARKETLLAKLRTESSTGSQKLTELEEKARRLEQLFGLLYGRNQQQPLGEARVADYRGVLDWPLRGDILERFGRHRNPKFAVYTVSNGMKIESPPGAPVRAMFAGTVLFSQWFRGYGNLVIVDHGDRVFSLYGNTRNVRVAVGQKVAPRQVIAEVAEGDEGSGGHLYFEIREDNKPVDPLTWLR